MTGAETNRASYLLGKWVEGWCRSRETPAPEAFHGGWVVEVGLPEHKRRYIFPGLAAGFDVVTRTMTDQHVFLKVVAARDEVTAKLPESWIIEGEQHLMSIDLLGKHEVDLPTGYKLRIIQKHHVASGQINGPDGDLAAWGQAAQVGDAAIFDRVETALPHRRRGLGASVMRALEDISAARGAHTGILVATDEGRALYEKLGWRHRVPITTAVFRQ